MTTIIIRNLDKNLVASLRTEAARHGHSIE